jgi:hypothetical protein
VDETQQGKRSVHGREEEQEGILKACAAKSDVLLFLKSCWLSRLDCRVAGYHAVGLQIAGMVVMPGKRVQFDNEMWAAIDMLAKDQMKSFPELADEAFRDLLNKHGRPADLKDALRRSAGKSATVHELRPKKRSHKR